MPTTEERAFLSRIREQPDEDGPRLIFADWLDDQGDSRAEFIRVQCALAHLPDDDPRRAELEQQEHILLEIHQAVWSAKLQGLASAWTYRRGLIEAISVDATAFLERGAEIFRHGPIRRVRFIEAGRCFPKLVESPLLTKIPEIDLCGNFLGNGGIQSLSRARQLNQLESLHLGFNDLTNQGLRALAELPQLSHLRQLFLDDNKQLSTPGIRALADSPYLGQLRLLDLSGNGLTEPAIRVILNGDSLSRLDTVRLAGNQIGDGGVAALAQSELFRRILARSPVLNLSRNNIGPVGARALGESEIMEPLEELDLGINAIGDTGMASLAQSPHLRHLKRLLLTDNRITDNGVRALAQSRLPETLDFIDLTGNFVTSDSIHALDAAARAFDWRKKIEVKIDAGLHLRATRAR